MKKQCYSRFRTIDHCTKLSDRRRLLKNNLWVVFRTPNWKTYHVFSGQGPTNLPDQLKPDSVGRRGGVHFRERVVESTSEPRGVLLPLFLCPCRGEHQSRGLPLALLALVRMDEELEWLVVRSVVFHVPDTPRGTEQR